MHRLNHLHIICAKPEARELAIGKAYKAHFGVWREDDISVRDSIPNLKTGRDGLKGAVGIQIPDFYGIGWHRVIVIGL